MIKTFEVKNIELTLASIFIDIKSKPSTTALVLSKLIEFSDKGVVSTPAVAGVDICRTLSITPVNYRAIMVKLTKMELIKRSSRGLELNKLIAGPLTGITIKEKQ